MLKLNLGCQIHYFEGWTNVDIIGNDPNIKVDINADACHLPMIADETVDFSYAGHLVEHFYPDTLGVAISEWHRVLRPGGRLVVVTPDCGSVFKDYASGKLKTIEETWQQIYGRIYHYDSPPERHHIAFDEECLRKMLASDTHGPTIGVRPYRWSRMERLDFNHPPAELVPFMDSHISRATYQLGLVLTK